jgi:hypothetical protein
MQHFGIGVCQRQHAGDGDGDAEPAGQAKRRETHGWVPLLLVSPTRAGRRNKRGRNALETWLLKALRNARTSGERCCRELQRREMCACVWWEIGAKVEEGKQGT